MEIPLRYQLTGFTVVLMAFCSSIFVPTVYGHAEEGKTLFGEHCVECHGTEGDGRGAIGPYLNGQRPANLLAETTQARSDQELFEIIKYGVHLEMPTWEDILNDQDIRNVVLYLRDLASRSASTSQ